MNKVFVEKFFELVDMELTTTEKNKLGTYSKKLDESFLKRLSFFCNVNELLTEAYELCFFHKPNNLKNYILNLEGKVNATAA